MVRRRRRLMRPAPVCRVTSSGGTADPVRMKCPLPARSSMVWRTWFQIAGSTCHSSIKRGVFPSRTRRGSTAIMFRACLSLSRNTVLAATRRANSVLPQARGPLDQNAAGPGEALLEFLIGHAGNVGSDVDLHGVRGGRVMEPGNGLRSSNHSLLVTLSATFARPILQFLAGCFRNFLGTLLQFSQGPIRKIQPESGPRSAIVADSPADAVPKRGRGGLPRRRCARS